MASCAPQFKRSGFSAYERILLSRLQRTDADVVAQFAMAVLLGGMVGDFAVRFFEYSRRDPVTMGAVE